MVVDGGSTRAVVIPTPIEMYINRCCPLRILSQDSFERSSQEVGKLGSSATTAIARHILARTSPCIELPSLSNGYQIAASRGAGRFPRYGRGSTIARRPAQMRQNADTVCDTCGWEGGKAYGSRMYGAEGSRRLVRALAGARTRVHGAAPRSRLLRSAQTGIPSFHAPIQTEC